MVDRKEPLSVTLPDNRYGDAGKTSINWKRSTEMFRKQRGLTTCDLQEVDQSGRGGLVSAKFVT
jgi:hypothetical protein